MSTVTVISEAIGATIGSGIAAGFAVRVSYSKLKTIIAEFAGDDTHGILSLPRRVAELEAFASSTNKIVSELTTSVSTLTSRLAELTTSAEKLHIKVDEINSRDCR